MCLFKHTFLLILHILTFVCLISPPPPQDWRMHCATSYAKDGFWLYLTQIASCSPWIFWMFLNSVFHLMWVAVLIMCQLYQVKFHLDLKKKMGGLSGISADLIADDCRLQLLGSPQMSG